MHNDHNRRLRGEQKEVGTSTFEKANRIDESIDDTEFADESWMRSLMDTDSTENKGNLEYNPRTQTERYLGGEPVSNELLASPTDNNGASRTDVSTEASAEIAAPMRGVTRSDASDTQNPDVDGNLVKGSGLGILGLGSSILSLFFLPYLLAPLGIIFGYMAYRGGAKSMGSWSMVIGAIAIIGALLIYPLMGVR